MAEEGSKDTDGRLVGTDDGNRVGYLDVGFKDGVCVLGLPVEISCGWIVGADEGEFGKDEGKFEGNEVGVIVGRYVGELVGFFVGNTEGFTDGC